MRQVLASGSIIDVLPGGSRITLSCGAVIEGRPHDTDAYRATARDLGYGADTTSMCRQHDPTHAAFCDWLGVGDSPALLCTAGLRKEDEISRAEEAAVLAIQLFMRLSGGRPPTRNTLI